MFFGSVVQLRFETDEVITSMDDQFDSKEGSQKCKIILIDFSSQLDVYTGIYTLSLNIYSELN